ncbi:MAG TPA: hypothetical protein VLW85_18315 [Myxococcales bacterium]|nr:hypothetical protein [Myxococcales bacterium]
MSPEEAFAEARRRWGAHGAISLTDRFRRARCLAGELRDGRFFIRGRGSTWVAAFVDADAREAHASRRHAQVELESQQHAGDAADRG